MPGSRSGGKPRQRKTPPLRFRFSFAPADETMHAEAGVPVGAMGVRSTEWGVAYGAAWANYRIEVVGEIVGQIERGEEKIPRWPWPSFVLTPTDEYPVILTTPDGERIDLGSEVRPYVLKAWSVRIRHRTLPGYVESRWHECPDGVSTHLWGLDGPDYDHANTALLGLKLLQMVRGLAPPQGGRPKGRRFRTAGELLAAIDRIAEALGYDGYPVTQQNVADRMDITDRTLRAHLDDFGIRWTDAIKGTGSNG